MFDGGSSVVSDVKCWLKYHCEPTYKQPRQWAVSFSKLLALHFLSAALVMILRVNLKNRLQACMSTCYVTLSCIMLHCVVVVWHNHLLHLNVNWHYVMWHNAGTRFILCTGLQPPLLWKKVPTFCGFELMHDVCFLNNGWTGCIGVKHWLSMHLYSCLVSVV